MAKILIVDGDNTFCVQLSQYLKKLGYEAMVAHELRHALQICRTEEYALIFLETMLPDGSGIPHIGQFRSSPSAPEIIILTGKGDPGIAQAALENRAWHYIEKPVSLHEIQLNVERALHYREAKMSEKKLGICNFIIGNSPQIQECMTLAARAANASGSVLITGETGTGKELFAKALHDNSRRQPQPFITIDCTNITSTLAESLLFGYRKGAFTGADKNTEGMIAQSDKGTLFLDEIGDLPLVTQKSFLRVLQNKAYRPLGGEIEYHCDFRLVTATNKNLKKEIAAGSFREDLYFRISTFQIHLPPLRQRKDDILPLTMHYLENLCKDMGIPLKGISGDFMNALQQYNWPGNIRELFSILQAAVVNCVGESTLFPHALPTEFRIQILKDKINQKNEAPSIFNPSAHYPEMTEKPSVLASYKTFRLESEAGYVKQLMEKTRGNIKEATSISGMSRARLYQLLQKHKLTLRH